MSGEPVKRRKREQNEDERRALLERGAIEASQRWVIAWREGLRKQGRRMTGGWPGTIVEARAHVSAYLGEELKNRRMTALTFDELDKAARTTYAAAKRDWQSHCEPDSG